MNKQIEEKVKKIIDEYSYFLGDGDEYNFNMPKVIEELSTLIQKEREEIYKEVAKDIKTLNKCHEETMEIMESVWKEEAVRGFRNFCEEEKYWDKDGGIWLATAYKDYLSQTKGGKK
jgi:Mg2+ and Co2+ transporter CorA